MATVIQAHSLQGISWLRFGFSTRAGGRSTVYGAGGLNLGFTAQDDPARVIANRQIIRQEIAPGDCWRMAAARQVHGSHIHIIRTFTEDSFDMGGRRPVEADGLMTNVPGVLLAIQVADCVPVLLADRRLRAVAALHAGWRGTAGGIVAQAIERMVAEYGSKARDLAAAIGPAIGRCCYVVGPELYERFDATFSYAADLFDQAADGLHLDLAEANRRQLLAGGVSADAVSLVAECTSCTRIDGGRKYFSHRAEHGSTGRSMALIGIAPSP